MVSEEQFQKFKKIDTNEYLSQLLRDNQIYTPEIHQSIIDFNSGYGVLTKENYVIIATQSESDTVQFELYDGSIMTEASEIKFPELKYHNLETEFLEDLVPKALDGFLPNVLEFVEREEYQPVAIVQLFMSSMDGAIVYSREQNHVRDSLELMVVHETDSGLYAAKHIHRSIVSGYEPKKRF